MNDQQRLSAIRERLNSLTGISPEQYARLCGELDAWDGRVGYDDQGRLRVLFFDAKSYDIESFDDRNQQRFDLHYFGGALDQDTVHAAAGFKAICIFVNDVCHSGIVEALAALGVELIALRCAGYNNVDLDVCQAKGMRVVRVPAYSPYAVAEHTVALMLMLNRRLHQAYTRNRAGYFVLDGLTGFDMRGKTAGVIGTGMIGQVLVEILMGFGCRVLAFDKFPNPELGARAGVEYVELPHLLRESDIVSLHVPLMEDTHHLIDRQAIDQMKQGVMLINTSRGGLIDTRALIDGLKSGKIGAAGLDVYEEEAGIFFHDMSGKVLTDDVLARLLTFNNVVITSHQAFLTREALGNIADTTLASIAQFEQGAELTNQVRLARR